MYRPGVRGFLVTAVEQVWNFLFRHRFSRQKRYKKYLVGLFKSLRVKWLSVRGWNIQRKFFKISFRGGNYGRRGGNHKIDILRIQIPLNDMDSSLHSGILLIVKRPKAPRCGDVGTEDDRKMDISRNEHLTGCCRQLSLAEQVLNSSQSGWRKFWMG